MIGEVGKLLLLVGALLMAVGLLLLLAGRMPWLGKLPGDLYYRGDHVTVYFPLVTCVLISIVLSVLLYLFRR